MATFQCSVCLGRDSLGNGYRNTFGQYVCVFCHVKKSGQILPGVTCGHCGIRSTFEHIKKCRAGGFEGVQKEITEELSSWIEELSPVGEHNTVIHNLRLTVQVRTPTQDDALEAATRVYDLLSKHFDQVTDVWFEYDDED